MYFVSKYYKIINERRDKMSAVLMLHKINKSKVDNKKYVDYFKHLTGENWRGEYKDSDAEKAESIDITMLKWHIGVYDKRRKNLLKKLNGVNEFTYKYFNEKSQQYESFVHQYILTECILFGTHRSYGLKCGFYHKKLTTSICVTKKQIYGFMKKYIKKYDWRRFKEDFIDNFVEGEMIFECSY
jgi:hypothetical protein